MSDVQVGAVSQGKGTVSLAHFIPTSKRAGFPFGECGNGCVAEGAALLISGPKFRKREKRNRR